MCILYLVGYNFTRFRFAENRSPQDHFRCVMVCYHTYMLQKTRPETELMLGLLVSIVNHFSFGYKYGNSDLKYYFFKIFWVEFDQSSGLDTHMDAWRRLNRACVDSHPHLICLQSVWKLLYWNHLVGKIWFKSLHISFYSFNLKSSCSLV